MVVASKAAEIPAPDFKIPRSVFLLFQELIHQEAGIWLGEHKKALLSGRLGRRLRELGLDSFERYYQLAAERAEECATMLDLITTNETHFFRDPQQFKYLEEVLVPNWKQEAESGRRAQSINVWSAGCSTGEEPFSILMVLLEHFPPPSGWSIHILGTDISTRVLEKCRRATWPIERAKEIPLADLRRYMLKGTGTQARWMRAKPEVEDRIRFDYLNLNSPAYSLATKFDLIFCRNVLMYFSSAAKMRVLEKLFAQLARGGRLFLSPAESAASTGIGSPVFPGVYQDVVCPDPAQRGGEGSPDLSRARPEGAGEGTL